MIFHFPDLETLRIALTSGMAPAVAVEPAEAAFDGAGRVSVKAHSIPPKAMQNALKRLGVKTGKAHVGEPIAVGCWPEILPVVKVAGALELAPAVAVLFELPADGMADFAGEMLRLGNDRQSFRYLADGGRVLLRVIGPPYYTLLRTLDQLTAGVVAYVEKTPRAWVQIGHVHPLAASLKVPEGRLLLLRPPRNWTTLDDGPFHDIYEILDFQLPTAAVAHAEGKLESRLSVPLRLAPGNAAEAPEMWVLKENAIEVFDAFVRDADERLTGRLMFAVTENGESEPAIVLRVRQHAKMAPPAVEINGAAGFARYRKLNNLFVPAGSRLQPTLRRDAVRKLLAEDDARIVWLTPLNNEGDGRFVPESLPDEAFRPLQDWVDYIIDRERQALQSWVQASTFDFDSFVCKGELPEEPPPAAKPKTRKADQSTKPDAGAEPASASPPRGKKKSAPKSGEEAFAAPVAAATPSEHVAKRDELEKAFLATDGPIDAPERVALWPQLARVNGALSDNAEAAICWLNALWERDDLPAAWLSVWFHTEANGAGPAVTAADLDRALTTATPTQSDMRRLAARLLYACTCPQMPAALNERLPAIRRYLEMHDTHLGVRAAWLVWLHLTRISGDVLGLARVRDRLLERLFKHGLKRQFDVPTFIHFAGQRDSERLRRVQEHLMRFRGEAHEWLAQQDQSKDALHRTLAPTGGYADLLFAYGLAKLGEERHRIDLTTAALSNVRSAKSGAPSERIALFLADAFEFRIEQAVRGKEIGPLPPEILSTLDGMEPTLLYGVNRLRKQLHILEPHEKSDPYLVYKKQNESTLIRDLAALQPLTDPKRLPMEVRRILKNNGKPLAAEDRMTALIETIPLTIRAGPEFAREMLDHVMPALAPAGPKAKGAPIVHKGIELQARLIDAAVPIAANYDWAELVQQMLTQFVANLRTLDEAAIVDSINLALGQWLRALRRCGLKDQLNALLDDLTDLLLKGRSLEALRHEFNREANRKNWVDMLRSLLHLSECWIYFGGQARAMPFIDEARLFLFDNKSKTAKDRPIATRYAPLVCAYIRALGQLSDLNLIVERFNELLQKMDVIPNTQTTNNHYSGMHLGIVESLVLALVSDDFILGETARRWLDDDEYLVRRRIHADMKKLLSHSGL